MEYFAVIFVVILILGINEIRIAQNYLQHIRDLAAKERQKPAEDCKINFPQRRVS